MDAVKAAEEKYPKPKAVNIPDDYYNDDFCRRSMEMELLQTAFISGYEAAKTRIALSAQPGEVNDGVEKALNRTMFMNGGNTDREKKCYAIGFVEGWQSSQPKEDGLLETVKIALIYRDFGVLNEWLHNHGHEKIAAPVSPKEDAGIEEDQEKLWIDVNDKLPTNIDAFSNDRILFVHKGIVRSGCYDYEFGDWTETGGGIYKNATHWMPLPKPPISITLKQ